MEKTGFYHGQRKKWPPAHLKADSQNLLEEYYLYAFERSDIDIYLFGLSETDAANKVKLKKSFNC